MNKKHYSKEELIESLKQMKREPKSVSLVSAMCYEVSISYEDIEYYCPICKQNSIYSLRTSPGQLIQNLAYIRRSLKNLPFNIVIDTSSLCQNCGTDKEPKLVFTVDCFDCGQKFSWEITTEVEIDSLKLLFLKPPITTIDVFSLASEVRQDELTTVNKVIEYIVEHLFCPESRAKVYKQIG